MGFGTIFASIAFVLAIGLAFYFFVSGGLFSVNALSNSFKKMNEIGNERLKTEIEIGNVSVGPGSEIMTKIKNTGSIKISDFEHIDVFINSEEQSTKWIPYSYTNKQKQSNSRRNEWTIVDISPDLVNPGIFDPDEEMEISINVFPPIKRNRMNCIKVVMANGVSDSKYFQH